MLYANYSAVLYGIIRRVIPDEETARDVLQEVFVKIWKNLDQYDASKGRIYTWMINVARNTAIDKTRSKGEIMKRKIHRDEAVVYEGAAAPQTTQQTDTIGLSNLVSDLKPEHQVLIDLAYYKGFTQDEIARTLDLPLGTVKTRLRQAIKVLRDKFGNA